MFEFGLRGGLAPYININPSSNQKEKIKLNQVSEEGISSKIKSVDSRYKIKFYFFAKKNENNPSEVNSIKISPSGFFKKTVKDDSVNLKKFKSEVESEFSKIKKDSVEVKNNLIKSVALGFGILKSMSPSFESESSLPEKMDVDNNFNRFSLEMFAQKESVKTIKLRINLLKSKIDNSPHKSIDKKLINKLEAFSKEIENKFETVERLYQSVATIKRNFVDITSDVSRTASDGSHHDPRSSIIASTRFVNDLNVNADKIFSYLDKSKDFTKKMDEKARVLSSILKNLSQEDKSNPKVAFAFCCVKSIEYFSNKMNEAFVKLDKELSSDFAYNTNYGVIKGKPVDLVIQASRLNSKLDSVLTSLYEVSFINETILNLGRNFGQEIDEWLSKKDNRNNVIEMNLVNSFKHLVSESPDFSKYTLGIADQVSDLKDCKFTVNHIEREYRPVAVEQMNEQISECVLSADKVAEKADVALEAYKMALSKLRPGIGSVPSLSTKNLFNRLIEQSNQSLSRLRACFLKSDALFNKKNSPAADNHVIKSLSDLSSLEEELGFAVDSLQHYLKPYVNASRLII